MKVLFLTNVPSPYRVDFFNELGKYCDLTVVFEKNTSTERDKSWSQYKFNNFKGVFLKGFSIGPDTAICFGVKKIIKNGKFDKIICTNFLNPTGMLAISYMRRKKIPYYLESDGGFFKNGKGIKEKIKRHFIKDAFGYFSTAKVHDEYYKFYGAVEEKIYRYPFTSISKKDVITYVVTNEEKLNLRQKLEIKERFIILAVGQFIHRKGFDILLKSTISLPKDVGVYFVGGIPTDEYINIVNENNLNNVHFVGFKSKEDLKEYYKSADVFVLPTREDIWGLVVNESMANALPVITTTNCISGLELVVENKTGILVPVEDVDALTNAINKLINDNDTLNAMRQNCLDVIELYTIENMVKKHIEILKARN